MGPRWFVRGDLDGFFGLALDNLVQLLVIDALCRFVLGFPDELLYGTVLPAAALSILVGNIFYSWQAMKLARQEGRDDVCALPYGINTPSVFAYVFLVMLPVKLATGDARLAWQAGLVACLGSGLIEVGGAFCVDWLRRNVPRAALLSTLAGIAVTFISMPFLFRTFASPVVGLSTFAVVSLVYFGRFRFHGGVPGGLVAVCLGTALAWGQGMAGTGPTPAPPG
ncbi:MAG: NCS2 family permease, partial [Myxococcota bacterium]|nr:NCS2 family permease [Myxococcota bacterium]